MLPVRLTVNCPVLLLVSETLASLAVIVTAGRVESLSAIVTVALEGETMLYAAFALRVTITVSLLSTELSSRGVTMMGADEAPAGIVTEVPMDV